MRARFVTEKFKEKSDPIKDMGIGTRKFLEMEYARLSKMRKPDIQTHLNIKKYNIDNEWHEMFIGLIFISMIESMVKKQTIPNAFHDAYNYWKFRIGYQLKAMERDERWPNSSIVMTACRKILLDKYGIEWDSKKIYEKFQEKSDPIKDMGIGTDFRSDIHKFVFFGYNFPSNFIENAWKDDDWMISHLRDKFNSLYDKYGSGEVMNRFYVELDDQNREILEEWIIKNYKG